MYGDGDEHRGLHIFNQEIRATLHELLIKSLARRVPLTYVMVLALSVPNIILAIFHVQVEVQTGRSHCFLWDLVEAGFLRLHFHMAFFFGLARCSTCLGITKKSGFSSRVAICLVLWFVFEVFADIFGFLMDHHRSRLFSLLAGVDGVESYDEIRGDIPKLLERFCKDLRGEDYHSWYDLDTSRTILSSSACLVVDATLIAIQLSVVSAAFFLAPRCCCFNILSSWRLKQSAHPKTVQESEGVELGVMTQEDCVCPCMP